jgi:penicillin-binding protein-related factor A (putative recombinase)
MKELSSIGAICWRNNTGAYKAEGRYVRYGLCVGSSDIIGIYKGRFLAVEVKRPQGRVTKEQKNFIRIVNEMGGIGFVARCKEDIKKYILGIDE